MQRILIIIGAGLLLVGLLWPWLSRLGLGRLPGDVRVETENGLFYFPITTCVIISAVISLVLWFIRRQLAVHRVCGSNSKGAHRAPSILCRVRRAHSTFAMDILPKVIRANRYLILLLAFFTMKYRH
jgi:hypothetical protein